MAPMHRQRGKRVAPAVNYCGAFPNEIPTNEEDWRHPRSECVSLPHSRIRWIELRRQG
jgi:hypothetical protein